MTGTMLIASFWCLAFLCPKFSHADTLLKFSKVDELSGFTCPAYHIIFSYEDGLSASQCLLLCAKRDCYGYFLRRADGKCIGCRDKFPNNDNYLPFEGMLFYRAPISIEYLITGKSF